MKKIRKSTVDTNLSFEEYEFQFRLPIVQFGLFFCSINYLAGLPIYLLLFPNELHVVIFIIELPLIMLPMWLLTFSYFFELPFLLKIRTWLAGYVYLALGVCHAVFNTLNFKYGTPMVGDILPMIFLFGCLFCGLNTKQAAIVSGLLFILIVTATLWAEYTWPVMMNQFTQWLFFIIVMLFVNSQSHSMLRKLYDYQQELKTKSSTDSLTKMLNRSALEEHISMVRRQSARDDKVFCLLVIDLDNFKDLNDTHGHLTGDKALTTVADILKSCTRRPLDCACRWGGDEFIVILYDIDYQNVSNICQLIKKKLRCASVDNPASTFNNHQTVTIGGALGKLGDDSNDKIISLADQALFQAKREGKNTYAIYEYPPTNVDIGIKNIY